MEQQHKAPGGTQRHAPPAPTLFDGTAVELAMLDEAGVIVAVNEAWTRFCVDNGGDPARCGVGIDYLALCDAAGDPTSTALADAMRAALADELPTATRVALPCHAPDRPRWFDVLVATRYDGGAPVGATVLLAPTATAPEHDAPAEAVAAIAHDIANALTIVGAHLEDLTDPAPGPAGADTDTDADADADAERHRAIGAVERAVVHTRRLLAELTRPGPRTADVADVADLLISLTPLLADHLGPTHRLVVEPGHGTAPVRVTPLALTQALANLVANARAALDAAGRRPGTVRLTAATTDDAAGRWAGGATSGAGRAVPASPSGAAVLIEVADDGTGITDAALPRLFERAYSTRGGGSGIGLSTVADLMTGLGGAVTVRSRPGSGSTFTLWFPIGEDDA